MMKGTTMFDALKRWLDPERIERERAIEWRTPESERGAAKLTAAAPLVSH